MFKISDQNECYLRASGKFEAESLEVGLVNGFDHSRKVLLNLEIEKIENVNKFEILEIEKYKGKNDKKVEIDVFGQMKIRGFGIGSVVPRLDGEVIKREQFSFFGSEEKILPYRQNLEKMGNFSLFVRSKYANGDGKFNKGYISMIDNGEIFFNFQRENSENWNSTKIQSKFGGFENLISSSLSSNGGDFCYFFVGQREFDFKTVLAYGKIGENYKGKIEISDKGNFEKVEILTDFAGKSEGYLLLALTKQKELALFKFGCTEEEEKFEKIRILRENVNNFDFLAISDSQNQTKIVVLMASPPPPSTTKAQKPNPSSNSTIKNLRQI
jgi:hypothetical protein